MTLTEQIQDDMKSAMKEKNQAKLAAVRAIKAEILKEQTSGKGSEVTDADVLKLIQK
ncbi:MAG: GatB/YqeY domain-containing protein, partial [Bacteroidales bacterium]|nr:GatB/YqeY domain-containing protein [Bacteroidales bacterium]